MTQPTLDREKKLWQQGHMVVAGLDEVGRGAWAGPVVAAAVVWPPTVASLPKQLRDSKQLPAKQRQEVAGQIKQAAQWAIGQAEVAEISQLGIAQATFVAMDRAASQLQPDWYLLDAFQHPSFPPNCQQAIIKGDAHVASIAAASIIAKVYRDELMNQLNQQFPEYGFGQHKGYGTARHQQAIRKYGLSPVHRQTFHLKFMDKA